MNPLDIADVSKCSLCVSLGKDHVPSYGSPNANLMIIGQSPGATEVIRGKPFVGECGELLDFMLQEAQIEREECYIANILKCRPPNNRVGTPVEISNCWRQWLHDEIKIINPGFVLLLGKDAHTTVLPKKYKFGHRIVTQSKKRTYITSYHPGYFLRQRNFGTFIAMGPFIREVMEAVNDKEESVSN